MTETELRRRVRAIGVKHLGRVWVESRGCMELTYVADMSPDDHEGHAILTARLLGVLSEFSRARGGNRLRLVAPLEVGPLVPGDGEGA